MLFRLGVNPVLTESPRVPHFPDNTRYTAIGDSITHGGWYVPYVDLYSLTRFPKHKLDVFNCGVNGDTAEGAIKRYAWDIAPTRPTIATIMFGMNDINRDLYAVGQEGPEVEKQRLTHIDNYEKNLRELVGMLQRDKVRVIIILPSLFDNTASKSDTNYPGLAEGLAKIAARAQKVAGETGCDIIDFHGPMIKTTRERQVADPAFSMLRPDRVHPTVLGQLFMAYLFLKARQVPADVARVSINGKDGTLVQAVNCEIGDTKVESGTLSFRYSAHSLPFPIEEETRFAMTWAPFVEDLNREIFQVTDLAPGDYQLLIDDQPIRPYSAEELSKGVNLALESNTPQARQAQKVWDLYKQRQEFVFKMRTIAAVERSSFAPDAPRPATLDEMQPLLDAFFKSHVGGQWEKAIAEEIAAYRACKNDEKVMREKIEDMLPKIRALAQPQPHIVKINPIK